MQTEKYLNEQVSLKHRGDISWEDHIVARIARAQNHPGRDIESVLTEKSGFENALAVEESLRQKR